MSRRRDADGVREAADLLEAAVIALDEAEDDDERAMAWTAVEAALLAARTCGQREALETAWDFVLEAFTNVPEARENPPALVAAIAADLGASDPRSILAAGLEAFYAGRALEAASALGFVCERSPGDAFAAFLLGCALERSDRLDEARRQFARAAELDSETYFPPIQLTAAELDQVVETALAAMPPEIQKVVESDCVVEVHDFPDERLVREGVDPLVLGLFVGPEHGERAAHIAEGPAQVLLFIRNLEKECRSRDDLVDEVRVTLFHEIGHALGFDEDGVDDLGLA